MSVLESLTDGQIMEFKEVFSLFDRNGDGSITIRELGTVLRALGQHPTEGELQDMIEEVDANGSGKLEFIEFLVMMANHMTEFDPDEELKEIFQVFDKDGDGEVSRAELREILGCLGLEVSEAQVREMMSEIDGDGDGSLSFEEFKDLMAEWDKE